MNTTAPNARKLLKLAQNAMAKHKGMEAVQLLNQLLALNPTHTEALHTMGFIMHSTGNHQHACDFYRRAINSDYKHIKSYLMLSSVLAAQNKPEDAMAIAKQAVQVAPHDPDTHAELMSLLMRFNASHVVPEYVEKLLPEFPNNLDLHQFYCLALKINNQHEKADAAYREFTGRLRVPASFRIIYETHLPRLYMSVEEIEAVRANFQASIERFIKERPQVNLTLLTNPLFQLAFHNRDNKELTQLYCRMLRAIAPELNFVAPHCKATPVRADGMIRIGFVSSFLHHHSVGSCYRGVLLHLAKQPEFKVTFFNVSNIMDDKTQEILAAGVPMITLPKNIKAAQKVIADEKLDIIIYPEIGMDATTYYLAMMRLAPYQACFQGHPETTGIDTVDYVISSRSYEPPHAEENYSERLLCNAGVDTIFTRPKPPERWMTREELGLPTDKTLYVCPMSIQKFHPDFDRLLADILAQDATATLVLFNDFQQQAASDLMQQRLLTQCAPTRVIFLPWLPMEQLFSVMKTADAMLDTIYFGGGTTAQYAFGLGVPIVTMPGNYARGRVVYAYYSIMGIENAPIAADTQEYVRLALKLAHDKPYADALREEIPAKNHALFETEPYAPRAAQLMKDIVAQHLDSYRR